MYAFRGLGATPLASAIFRQEGSTDAAGNWNTGSLGYRLNNPGNLNYAGQAGCHATTLGNGLEAQCDTLDVGIQATENQLNLDASRGLTLAQRLQTWATGNPSAYVSNVSSWLGVSPDTPLTDLIGGSGGSGGSVPAADVAAADTASFDFSGTSGAGLSDMALLGLGIAAVGLVWAVLG